MLNALGSHNATLKVKNRQGMSHIGAYFSSGGILGVFRNAKRCGKHPKPFHLQIEMHPSYWELGL